jgi:hypothetical protein
MRSWHACGSHTGSITEWRDLALAWGLGEVAQGSKQNSNVRLLPPFPLAPLYTATCRSLQTATACCRRLVNQGPEPSSVPVRLCDCPVTERAPHSWPTCAPCSECGGHPCCGEGAGVPMSCGKGATGAWAWRTSEDAHTHCVETPRAPLSNCCRIAPLTRTCLSVMPTVLASPASSQRMYAAVVADLRLLSSSDLLGWMLSPSAVQKFVPSPRYRLPVHASRDLRMAQPASIPTQRQGKI